MKRLCLQSDPSWTGERIDKFLAEVMKDYSRSFLQKQFKEGNITVNGKPAKASLKVGEEDEIVVFLPENQEPDIEPENIPLDILYEDDQLLVVNKPKGMVVHPSAGHYSGTLVNALMYHCRDNLSGINGVLRPGIVHRIDMDTTGSLVVCKTDTAPSEPGRAAESAQHYQKIPGHRPWEYKGRYRDCGRFHRPSPCRAKENGCQCPGRERSSDPF